MGRPELAVAGFTWKGALPNFLFGSGPNVIVWLVGAMEKDCWTSGAGLKSPLPGWVARTVHVPPLTIVSVFPLTEQPPVVKYVIGRPDEAVAPGGMGAAPT